MERWRVNQLAAGNDDQKDYTVSWPVKGNSLQASCVKACKLFSLQVPNAMPQIGDLEQLRDPQLLVPQAEGTGCLPGFARHCFQKAGYCACFDVFGKLK